MNKVGLNQGFRRSWSDLKRLQQRIDARHGLVDAFDEAETVSTKQNKGDADELPGRRSCPCFII